MKTKYIENGLIIINLFLVLYLVYVLSNQTIETFYSNQGCEGLCNNSWSKPEIPRFKNQDSANMEIIDNHLYVSSIQLDSTIDERFKNVWFLKFTLSQGGVDSGYHEKLFSVGDAAGYLRKVNDQYNIFRIADILQTPDAWLKFKIKIDLKETVPVTTGDFTMKLSILDENMVEQTPIIEKDFTYKPCNEAVGDGCIDATDCCYGMFCIYPNGQTQKQCSYDCPTGFYDSEDSEETCTLCPSKSTITGCTDCEAGTYRVRVGDVNAFNFQSTCENCPEGTYRTIDMAECSSNCIAPFSQYQKPNPNTLTDCVDCEAGYAADSAGNACAQLCSGAQVPNADKSACIDCVGKKPNADNSACIGCDDNDYDWQHCSYPCGTTTRPKQSSRIKSDPKLSNCPATRERDCPHSCTDVCGSQHLYGTRYDGNTSPNSHGCCRPSGLSLTDGSVNDCGGPNDHEKRTYPCCNGGDEKCNLVTLRKRRARMGRGYYTKERHRCI